LDLNQILTNLNIKDLTLWTIDLAHVCAINNIRHSFYTINCVVQSTYSSIHFYSKTFEDEEKRINDKFKRCDELGIKLNLQSVPLDFIKNEISQSNDCVCIMLVDASKLNPKVVINIQNEENKNDECLQIDESIKPSLIPDCSLIPKLFGELPQAFNEIYEKYRTETTDHWKDKLFPSHKTNQSTEKETLVDSNTHKKEVSNYTGHFIVIIGYDNNNKTIFYRDPAIANGDNSRLSYSTEDDVEKARKSFGTDQDILFIYRD
jgi:hypothetical protein